MAAGDLITADLQVEWRGVLWGWPATTVGITDLQGWYGFTLRGNNIDRPGRHGSFPGQKRANERVVEVELTAVDEDPTALDGIRAATAVDEDPVEEALVIRAGTADAQYVLARLERFNIPTDFDWSVGHHRATLQWTATDPRRYSVVETVSPMIGLPTPPSGGLAFPLAFPLSFGTGTAVTPVVVTNSGDTATWPTFEIAGPVTGPIITNADTGQQLRFDPSFTVAAGQTMTVDTDARAVVVNGVARSDALVTRQWFPLPKGDTAVTFTGTGAYDPAAGLVIRFRSAWT